MAEDHRESDHSHAFVLDERYALRAVTLGLISAFLVGEVIAAVLGHSLALFADAAHMSTDVVRSRSVLGPYAWLGDRPKVVGLRPPASGDLSAAANGVALAAISLLIAVEAIQRLINPHHVRGSLVLVVALVVL